MHKQNEDTTIRWSIAQTMRMAEAVALTLRQQSQVALEPEALHEQLQDADAGLQQQRLQLCSNRPRAIGTQGVSKSQRQKSAICRHDSGCTANPLTTA